MGEMKVVLLEGGKRPSHQTRRELDAKGIKVTVVQDLPSCLAALEADRKHSVILDLDLHRAGIETLQKISSLFPDVAVIVMASLERLTVVDEALRQGAWDFVIKQPDLSHLQEIPQAIARSEERKRFKSESEHYQEQAKRLETEAQRYQEEAQKFQAESERYRNEAQSLREETGKLQQEIERYRDAVRKLQAESEPRQEETASLQAEAERLREEASRLRSALQESRDESPKEEAADEVLADIAEDLKSPLAAMIGYLEIASSISPERVEASQILSIQRVDALARRLFDLVMNHTGALDIEAGKLEIQKNPFEIKQILELAVQDRQSEASAKNIDLALESPNDLPMISIDAVQIERAVGILISNAINLSPLGSGVTVSLRRQDSEVAIAIKDSGAGIFQEEIPLLFNRKKKLRRRGADVNTVGLFVARHIVSMHGGRIDVQSNPVEGTTLTILLPV
ncbi:MAG: response regulator [Deltaproteobacteria bacterium]|nr:response regulator [Deltaproteobacteria bacterium]